MTLTLTIKMDNEAFTGNAGFEAARILREAAKRIDCGTELEEGEFKLFDVNGNSVGTLDVTE